MLLVLIILDSTNVPMLIHMHSYTTQRKQIAMSRNVLVKSTYTTSSGKVQR